MNGCEISKKRLQKAYYFTILYLFKKNMSSGKIYLSYFYDWRGRFYSNSTIDPLYNKVFRPFYKFKSVLDEDRIRESRYFKVLTSINLRLNDDLMLDYFTKVIYIELGKLHKNQLISREGVSIEAFIECGQRRKDEVLEDLESEVYRLSLVEGLGLIKESRTVPNLTIIRDATGSNFQH